MKGFLRLVFATIFGFFISLFLIFIMFAGAAGSSGKSAPKVSDNSILNLKLTGELKDRTSGNPFENFSILNPSFEKEESVGLFELKKTIENAKTDAKIKGIYLNTDGLLSGMSSIFEVRRMLEDFKKSGKFIIAYSDNQTQGSYILNAVADKVYLNPAGGFDFKGFNIEIMYFKGLMDKLGVAPMIFYAGEYKSATEPFRATQMSAENRYQLTELLSDIHNNYVNAISESRNIPAASLNLISDSLQASLPQEALNLKLVDGLMYEDQVRALLMKKVGVKKEKDLKLVSYHDYKGSIDDKSKSKDKVAVLVAEGDIVDGKGKSDQIGSETFVKQIKDIEDDDHVKALVLRVNSPGGSAFASEQIWRELMNLKAKKIPIVVSMGDYAASGGYYISTPADYIISEANTLTGSIGVFGMMFNTEKLLKEKAGLSFDGVKTNTYSDFGNMNRPWTDLEKNVMTENIQNTYTTFKTRVADSRKMTLANVDTIARGRIWSGQDAIGIGLVDALGNIDKAIAKAKELAKVKDVKVEYYPVSKPFYEEMIEGFTETKADTKIKELLGDDYEVFNALTYLKTMKGPQARLPYVFQLR